ncbi:hypothetical protein PSY27_23600, partial [Shigella flexneri]|nr:hypothetical protein [Shigella flexneri]
RNTQPHQVQHRFLTKIVVDTVNLLALRFANSLFVNNWDNLNMINGAIVPVIHKQGVSKTVLNLLALRFANSLFVNNWGNLNM